MSKNFKNISIYIDQQQMLLGVPGGESKKYGMVELDMIFTLALPYNEEELESFLMMVFDKCYSEAYKDDGVTSIEKHYGIKGYAKATKNLKLVDVSWAKNDGYSIIPYKKMSRSGYSGLSNDKIERLGNEFNKGDLAKAFLRAMELAE